ncbi:hypothetical protein PG985_003938 [Apiospora marii]|uniref:Berberine/berberine-like domain-containing protein n=1 Tax=Apiospora marii TaxID=335849 RepID=A0ABR1SGN6_9PEZI
MDSFYAGVHASLKSLLSMTDAGAAAIWFVTPGQFSFPTIYGPGIDREGIDAFLSPVLRKLETLGIKYTHKSQQHSSFTKGFLAQSQVNVSNLNIGGRLVPRELVQDSASLAALGSQITSNPYSPVYSGVTFNVSMNPADHVAANPYWRDSAVSAVIEVSYDYTEWENNLEIAEAITHEILRYLSVLRLMELHISTKRAFNSQIGKEYLYGPNWSRLSNIKTKYDPEDIFYALGAVGSQKWVEQPDGRLCETV